MEQTNHLLRRFQGIMAAIIFLLGTAVSVFQYLQPTQANSELENRTLQTRPELAYDQVISGRYMEKYEHFVEDQFPFRNLWIQLCSLSDRVQGITESNGIYLGSQGYLIQSFTPSSDQQTKELTDNLVHLKENFPDIDYTAMIVPTSALLYANKLPICADAGGREQALYLNTLSTALTDGGYHFIDLISCFSQYGGDTQLYYCTDHHWTTDAAYLAYQEYARTHELKGLDVPYERKAITEEFSGTLVSTSGWRLAEREPIYVYFPREIEQDYTVTYISDSKASPSCYQTEYLENRDKYSVFFGGNHDLIQINTSAQTGKRLLVLKDSYANCFIPFLLQDYEQILVVDPRYFADSLNNLIISHSVTDIMILYCASGLSQDTALSQMLKVELEEFQKSEEY